MKKSDLIKYLIGVALTIFGLLLAKIAFFELGLMFILGGLYLIDRTKMPRKGD